MVVICKKLALISHEAQGMQEYFGFHRDIVRDIAFGGGVHLQETFELLNKKGLTLEEAESFFAEHFEGNEKIKLNGKDFFVLNRYINDYIRVPLLYEKFNPNPINNRVGDYIADFLVDVKGWAKVQDCIITTDPYAYTTYFDYAYKGYPLDIRNTALKFNFKEDRFDLIDNSRRIMQYSEDKELYETAASRLSHTRQEFYRRDLQEQQRLEKAKQDSIREEAAKAASAFAQKDTPQEQ